MRSEVRACGLCRLQMWEVKVNQVAKDQQETNEGRTGQPHHQ